MWGQSTHSPSLPWLPSILPPRKVSPCAGVKHSGAVLLSYFMSYTTWLMNIALRWAYFCIPGQHLGWLCNNFSLSVSPTIGLCADCTYFLSNFGCPVCRQVLKSYSKVKFWLSSHVNVILDYVFIHIYIYVYMHMHIFCSSKFTALKHRNICLENMYKQAGSSICFSSCLCHSALVLQALQNRKAAQHSVTF